MYYTCTLKMVRVSTIFTCYFFSNLSMSDCDSLTASVCLITLNNKLQWLLNQGDVISGTVHEFALEAHVIFLKKIITIISHATIIPSSAFQSERYCEKRSESLESAQCVVFYTILLTFYQSMSVMVITEYGIIIKSHNCLVFFTKTIFGNATPIIFFKPIVYN